MLSKMKSNAARLLEEHQRSVLAAQTASTEHSPRTGRASGKPSEVYQEEPEEEERDDDDDELDDDDPDELQLEIDQDSSPSRIEQQDRKLIDQEANEQLSEEHNSPGRQTSNLIDEQEVDDEDEDQIVEDDDENDEEHDDELGAIKCDIEDSNNNSTRFGPASNRHQQVKNYSAKSDRKRSQDQLLGIVECSKRRRLSHDSADSLIQFIRWSFDNIKPPGRQLTTGRGPLIREAVGHQLSPEVEVEVDEEQEEEELEVEPDEEEPDFRQALNFVGTLEQQQHDWTTAALMRRQLRALKPADLILHQAAAKLTATGNATSGSRLKSQLSGLESAASAVARMGPARDTISPDDLVADFRSSQRRKVLFSPLTSSDKQQHESQRQSMSHHHLSERAPIVSHLQHFLEQQQQQQQQQQQARREQQSELESLIAGSGSNGDEQQQQHQTSSQLALAAAIHRALMDSCQLPAAPAGESISSNRSTASSTASSSTSTTSTTTNGENLHQHPHHNHHNNMANSQLNQHLTSSANGSNNSNGNSSSSSSQPQLGHKSGSNNLHHLLALNDLTRLHQSQQRRIYNTRHSSAAAAAAAAVAAAASSSTSASGAASGSHGLGQDQGESRSFASQLLTQQQQQLLASAAAVATNRVQQQRHAQAAAALSALAASAGQSHRTSLHQQAAALIQGVNQQQQQQLNACQQNGASSNPLHLATQTGAIFPNSTANQHSHSHPHHQNHPLGGVGPGSLLNIDFKCDICPSSFDDRHRLMQHQSIHLELKKEWFTETPVDEVMKIFNRRRGEFLCNICNLRFEATLDYDQHNHEHHGSRPYCCQFCGNGTRTFKCWRQYLNHLYDHRYVFSCTIENCDFTVNRRDSLRFHIFRFHLNCQLPQQVSPHHQLQSFSSKSLNGPSNSTSLSQMLAGNNNNNNNSKQNNNYNSILQANYNNNNSNSNSNNNNNNSNSSGKQSPLGENSLGSPRLTLHS